MGFISGRERPPPHVRVGVEVLGSAGVDRAAEHRRRTLDSLGSGDRCPAGLRRRCLVSVRLAAGVRVGTPLAAPDETVWVGLSAGSMVTHRGSGRFLRRLEAADGATARWTRRLLDLPGPGERGFRRSTRWPRRTVGRRLSGPAIAIDDETAIKVVADTVESSPRGTGNCTPPRTETWARVLSPEPLRPRA